MKLVVALLLSVIAIYLVFRFKAYLAPLLLSFLLAYLLHPTASFLTTKLKIPWRVVSTILFVLLFLVVLGLMTWGGISIVEQIQNLVGYLQKLIGDLPGFVAGLSSKPLVLGPFTFDFSNLKLDSLWTQLQGIVEPILSGIGSLVGSIASGAATTVVGTIFIILIAYFIMVESGGVREAIIKLSVPGHQDDLNRLGSQISKIWNAFLRGQLLVFAITVVVYSCLLGALGVRYFFLLALLAGLARFVPYVGPFVAWTTYFLVALFQTNYLGMQQFPYAIMIVAIAWVTDVFMDNYVSPRIMSDALKVHPAAVLVTVFISASLFGFVGVLLSAPILASLQLIVTYATRKLMDLDPWEGLETIPPPLSIMQTISKWRMKLSKLFRKNKNKERSEHKKNVKQKETRSETKKE